MTGFDRRNTLRLVAASLIAGHALARPALAQHGSGGLIAPPQGRMLYRRTIDRPMERGARIRVAREFVVEFVPSAEGFLLQGRQVGVTVEAPEPLSRFAELEERRDESSLFPLALDAFGRIVSPAPMPSHERQITAAVQETIRALARQAGSQAETARAQMFVAAFHSSGQRAAAILPTDLFAPVGGERRTMQEIALPDGGEGRVETRFDGVLDQRTGLMSAAMREIITTVDTSSRTTREDWSLAAA